MLIVCNGKRLHCCCLFFTACPDIILQDFYILCS